MTHPVMECTVVTRFGALRIRREGSQVPYPRLVLDGTEDPIDGDLERSEVGIHPVDFNGVS